MFVKPIPGRSAPPLGAAPKEEEEEKTASPAPPPSKKLGGAKTDSSTPTAQALEPVPEPPKPRPKSALTHAAKPKLSSVEASSSPAGTQAAVAAPTPPNSKAIAKAKSLAAKPVVALVGPVSASKADAEATLARMRNMLGPTQGGAGGAALQAQVFETPEGWRPAVWPFASREEAQLINATLIARGMRTRAMDF